MLGVITTGPQSSEAIQLYERFANVFDHTYTRFLDLQKAETQTREVQIELALERVRARTMAMHKSEELSETAQVLFQQLSELGGIPDRISIGIADEINGVVNFWTTDQQGSQLDHSFSARLNERTTIAKTYQAWKEHKKSLVVDLHGEELKEWIQFAREEMGIIVKDDQIKNRRVHTLVFFSHGWILVSTHEPQSTETIQILERFASVFNLTYRRFLDLQKAEAQANEARIEIALERIRARALAMHKSDELMEVAKVLREQMALLGQPELEASVVHLYEEDPDHILSWRAFRPTESHEKIAYGHMSLPKNSCEFVREWLTKFYSEEKEYTIELSGAKQDEWYDLFFKFAPDVINSMREEKSINEKRYYRFSKFSGGALLMISKQEPSVEAIYLQKRAAVVFDLAYRRFSDLQKAEAQAREAQIEAALEKVRSRSLAMHKSDELQEVVNTLFERLEDLNIQMDSANIAIFKEGTRDYDYWIASHFQKRAASFHMPYTDLSLTRDLIADRESGKEFSTTAYSFEEKNEWFESAFKNTDFKFLSEERKQFILGAPAITVAIAFSKNTGVQINRYNSKLPTEGEAEILKRFSKVFEQAYIRFLDLEKAEAQANEAQIEASLERVRSKTMAMHNSQDVGNTVATMFDQLVHLGVKTNRCGILIFSHTNNTEVWTAKSNQNGEAALIIGHLDVTIHPMLQGVRNAWKNKETFFSYELAGENIKDYYSAINNYPDYPTRFNLDSLPTKEIHSDFFFPEGAVFAFTSAPITAEASQIFKRFAGVFGQTYRRYLDLQKAETQAREAQIEASLERVRSKTMAMHSSDDVTSATATMFTELDRLGIENMRCGIAHYLEDHKMEVWSVSNLVDGQVVRGAGLLDTNSIPFWKLFYSTWQKKEDFLYYYMAGKEKEDYFKKINTLQNYLNHSIEDVPDLSIQTYYFPEGSVWAFSLKPHSEDDKQVMKKFASVFSLTFRRYQDLKKAEAQARESQIEAGLERVRARTMAMHSSNDVGVATATMFTELEKLGIENLRGGITIIKPDQIQEVWSVTNIADGRTVRAIGVFDMKLHPLWRALLEGKERKEEYLYYWMAGKDKEDYINILNATPNYLSQPIKEFPDVHVQCYFFGEGAVWTNSLQPHSEEDKQVMKKFASVFSLTFRRYQDLKKAEAQAREATIEGALEKVRGKAMAMHNSNDLSVTTSMIITELGKLGIKPIRCGVGIINKETHKGQLYTARFSPDGDSLSVVGWVLLEGHPVLENIYEKWVEGEDYFPELSGDSRKAYYEQLLAGLSVPIPDFKDEQIHYGHFFSFSVGCLYAWSEVKYNDDEIKILKRFASIIDLTFRRYFELQKSETNAREAVKQAALDRVRAEIASMRTINDLDRITPLIWNELTVLGIPFIRCGVFIMDEDQQLIHTFLSTPDGKAIAAFHLPYDTPGNLRNVVSNWKQNKNYIDHWDETEFIQFADILVKGGALVSAEQYLKTIPKNGFYLHFLPFLQGMLYVGNTDQLKEEEIELIQHVADAFSTAYARYEDFNKLESAKQQVEKTLTDLKQAQTQLVQSEKMASLGEMTAGIAHEIQNPLNFVNNFSEVSKELLDEMKTELETGNTEDAKDIADDVIQNLEKINHHGKRADAIVKSMLQHSRSSSGKKEPTDINSLADEYLRLAYHGLRAKDKSFNAKFETAFDDSIGKINIISQDIGRVLVNLINNAFYAVSERKKQESNGYEPTVEVLTKKT
jgi:signal transduction histidine kinase